MEIFCFLTFVFGKKHLNYAVAVFLCSVNQPNKQQPVSSLVKLCSVVYPLAIHNNPGDISNEPNSHVP